jgi:hypothetical protein
MLNASFCGIDEITAAQAAELQDRNMTLHGNSLEEIDWSLEVRLTKIPEWLRTLERLKVVTLLGADVKEMRGGAFPPSLEDLDINTQITGLRLFPNSFEGLQNLRVLDATWNQLTEDNMHPGLFAGATRLRELDLSMNSDLGKFAASELFPGGSEAMAELHLDDCGLGEGTDFQGLPNLQRLDFSFNSFIPSRLFSGLCSLQLVALAGYDESEMSDDMFAGTTLCSAISDFVLSIMCEGQADADSGKMCGCQLGACSLCEEESPCETHSLCAWEADDGALGGSCSDSLIAPAAMDFFECAHFCSHEVEGGRVPCLVTEEDNNELLKRCTGGMEPWIGHYYGEGGFEWVDGTCKSNFENWFGTGGAGVANCAVMATDSGTSTGQWRERYCTWQMSCICQPSAEPAEIDFNWLGNAIYGYGTVWACEEEGRQPNAEKDGCECAPGRYGEECEVCEAGKASAGGGEEECAECASGSYASSPVGAAECVECLAGKYSSVAGSVSSGDCETCETGKTSEAGSSECVSGSATSACFTINLMNKWGDPWSGNVLIITSTSNDEVVFELTMSCTSYSDCAAAGFGPQIPESFEDMCFDNCGSCYSGQVGGGNHFDLAETSWNIQDASGEIVAESTSGHPACFCLNDACMLCEAGGRGGGC